MPLKKSARCRSHPPGTTCAGGGYSLARMLIRSPGCTASLAGGMRTRTCSGCSSGARPGNGSGAIMTRQPRSSWSRSTTRPVSATEPRRRSSIGVPSRHAANWISAKPAARQASRTAAAPAIGTRRSSTAAATAAAVAASPSHQGGSTVSAKYVAMPAPRKTGSQWARRSPSALSAWARARTG